MSEALLNVFLFFFKIFNIFLRAMFHSVSVSKISSRNVLVVAQFLRILFVYVYGKGFDIVKSVGARSGT